MKTINPRIIRKLHTWLMWIIGIQFLIWSLSGLYFTVFDIHYIHGESLQKQRHSVVNVSEVNYPFQELIKDYPLARNIILYSINGVTLYRFTEAGSSATKLLDAQTGQPWESINQQQATEIAQSVFNGGNEIKSINSLIESAPSELSPRHLPVWQVTFDDTFNSTLYISQKTGEVVTRRHDWWRLFDLFWRLHILDPFEGENITNPWLFGAAILGLLSLFSGLILMWYSLLRPALRSHIR